MAFGIPQLERRQLNLKKGLKVSGTEVINSSAEMKADVKDSLASGKIYVGNSSGVAGEVAMSGDATISNTGALTIANNAVTTAKINNGAVTTAKLATSAVSQNELADNSVATSKIQNSAVVPTKLGTEVVSGITLGAVKYKVVPSATVKTLLNGSANNLASFASGETILDVIFITSTAAGTAGTVNVGTDASWTVADDADAFIAAANANSAGKVRMILNDAAAQAAGAGSVDATGAANVKVQSSADLSASSWAGKVIIMYM